MRRRMALSVLFLTVLLTAAPLALAAEVSVTDAVGRTVSVPDPEHLKKLYVTSPIGFIFVYTLDLERLAGTPMKFFEQELKYLNPACAEMPLLGGMQMGKQLNREAIVAAGTQLLLSMGPAKPKATDASQADELQEQLGIPVVVVDASLENIEEAYAFLGRLLGREERAARLGAYCKAVLDDVKGKISAIPEERRVRVYYAEGPDGLSTEPELSSHAAVLKLAGARNVADVKAVSGSGMSPTSLEQVLHWDPEVIIAWEDFRGGAHGMIKKNPDWASLRAVKDGRVYAMPNTPFSWMDRPPSVNRFLGLQWVANLLYPEVYAVDIRTVTREFYDLFYSVKLTDDQLDDLLKNAGGVPNPRP